MDIRMDYKSRRADGHWRKIGLFCCDTWPLATLSYDTAPHLFPASLCGALCDTEEQRRHGRWRSHGPTVAQPLRLYCQPLQEPHCRFVCVCASRPNHNHETTAVPSTMSTSPSSSARASFVSSSQETSRKVTLPGRAAEDRRERRVPATDGRPDSVCSVLHHRGSTQSECGLSPLDVVLSSLLSHALSQVRRQGDLGDEVDGIKGDAVKFLGDDDGCRKRGVPSGHLARPQLLDGNDGGDCVKSSSDAGVRTMFDLFFASVTCLALLFPRMSTHRTTHGHHVCHSWWSMLSFLSLSFGCGVCLRHSAWLFTYFGSPSLSPQVRLVYLILVQNHANFAFFAVQETARVGVQLFDLGREWLAL